VQGKGLFPVNRLETGPFSWVAPFYLEIFSYRRKRRLFFLPILPSFSNCRVDRFFFAAYDICSHRVPEIFFSSYDYFLVTSLFRRSFPSKKRSIEALLLALNGLWSVQTEPDFIMSLFVQRQELFFHVSPPEMAKLSLSVSRCR